MPSVILPWDIEPLPLYFMFFVMKVVLTGSASGLGSRVLRIIVETANVLKPSSRHGFCVSFVFDGTVNRI